jgi:hypothetical protein
MEDTHKSDPMKFTRERLMEIGTVWKEFAKERAQTYKAKLPPSLKQYLQPKPKPEGEAPAEATAPKLS